MGGSASSEDGGSAHEQGRRQCPRNDGGIREVEHGPEPEVDEIDDTPTPQPIEEVATRTADRHPERHLRHNTLEERPELDKREQKGDLDNPGQEQPTESLTRAV